MKSKKLVQLLVIFTMMAFFMFGCGKTEVADAPEVETESVREELAAEEEVTAEEQPTEDVKTEESTEADTQEPTSMVDWETFATQADNDNICIVVSNETTGSQKVIMIPDGEKNTFYEPNEGDKFAVPIRDNIYWINVVTIKDTNIVSDEHIYIRGESDESQQFIEVSFPKGNNYNLLIKTEDSQEAMQFFIQNE